MSTACEQPAAAIDLLRLESGESIEALAEALLSGATEGLKDGTTIAFHRMASEQQSMAAKRKKLREKNWGLSKRERAQRDYEAQIVKHVGHAEAAAAVGLAQACTLEKQHATSTEITAAQYAYVQAILEIYRIRSSIATEMDATLVAAYGHKANPYDGIAPLRKPKPTQRSLSSKLGELVRLPSRKRAASPSSHPRPVARGGVGHVAAATPPSTASKPTRRRMHRLPRKSHFSLLRMALRLRSRKVAPNQRSGPLSPAALSAVTSSWVAISDNLEAHGVVLFRKIFEIAPEARDLFSFRHQPNMYENANFRAHAAKVMGTVGMAVAGLADVQKLLPLLKSLGRTHKATGVLPAHYDIVGEALLHTIRQALGPDAFTQEVEIAWSAVYQLVASTMIEGACYEKP